MESVPASATSPAPDKPDQEPATSSWTLRGYLRDSKSLLNCIVLVLPLFVIYQLGVLTTGGVQNGVDFVTTTLLRDVFGGNTLYYILFNLVVLAGLIGLVFVLRKRDQFHPRLYWAVILESTLYGVLLGFVVSTVLTKIGITPSAASDAPVMGPLDNFVLSLGAGLYEELVFRLILLGGSVWLGRMIWVHLKGPAPAGTEGTEAGGKQALTMFQNVVLVGCAVLVTSLLFSGIHYVGSLADAFTLHSFSYRFLAGVFFAGLYYARGFAVAVYTHAIYDVIVLVLLNSGS
jgi:hypothetical protein